eukprot:SAG22_NODE_77_length_22125_cov_46.140016_18_plen_110_part_00
MWRLARCDRPPEPEEICRSGQDGSQQKQHEERRCPHNRPGDWRSRLDSMPDIKEVAGTHVLKTNASQPIVIVAVAPLISPRVVVLLLLMLLMLMLWLRRRLLWLLRGHY